MELSRLDRQREHPFQARQLAIDFGVARACLLAGHHELKDHIRRDRNHPLAPEGRPQMQIDPTLGVVVRLAAIDLVVVKQILGGFVEVISPIFGMIGMPCSTSPSRVRRMRRATVSLIVPVLSRTGLPCW
jgi:hypothetical protein